MRHSPKPGHGSVAASRLCRCLAAQVGIQYCMTYARMLMHSLKIPAVTQFRASDDYHPGQAPLNTADTAVALTPRAVRSQAGPWPIPEGSKNKGCNFPYCVYYVGTTSLLGWALGVAPSKACPLPVPLSILRRRLL